MVSVSSTKGKLCWQNFLLLMDFIRPFKQCKTLCTVWTKCLSDGDMMEQVHHGYFYSWHLIINWTDSILGRCKTWIKSWENHKTKITLGQQKLAFHPRLSLHIDAKQKLEVNLNKTCPNHFGKIYLYFLKVAMSRYITGRKISFCEYQVFLQMTFYRLHHFFIQ